MFARYEDALIAKMRIHEWYGSRDGEAYLRNVLQSLNDKHDPKERLNTDGLVYLQRQMIKNSDPIYVSMDVTDVVDYARWTFEPEALLPGDPFVPCGFALFPRALLIDDAPVGPTRPNNYVEGIPIRAMAWNSMHTEDLSQGCFWIAYYVHIDDEKLAGGGFSDPDQIKYFRRYAPLTIAHQWQWSWGRVPSENSALVYDGETQEEGDNRARQQAALAQTFWRIGQQRVPVPERVPRGIWRDAQRKGFKHRDVKVLTLRRAQEKKPVEPTGRTMKVRSITDGHWRNQWYPSIREHRQIWIFPYIRGPEGAPLIQPTKAIEFKR